MLNKGIQVSLSLTSTLHNEGVVENIKYNKKRLLKLSLISITIAVFVSAIAKFLVHLIDFCTNLAFYGRFSTIPISPADNHLSYFVIFIPVIGGLLVGLLAFYGSKAIRGHGIPEAMEQILTNQSRIKPSITFLKPLSAAISIGTGGPFGAEGPIIATGGALGSTIGQYINITSNERKILLAAGATAGMATIFGTPMTAILLAIELLLFEFSPRSFIPVSLACITGAAGHHVFFGSGVAFPIAEEIQSPTEYALLFYSVTGVILGLFSVLITRIVYLIEDTFEKLPIHWAWWPAIGSVAVGIIGYFEPRTLGVGYNNITDLLSGSLPIQFVLSLCILKFISWSISLGSGTSGGTLAPLMTIGSALGILLGSVGVSLFPEIGISLPLCALVGMTAVFAGASRAFLTSIVFALESTGQINALLPLLATSTTAYVISYFLMKNTIMTEKIARRGHQTPSSYEPNLLEKILVEQITTDHAIIINETLTLKEVREWLQQESDTNTSYFVVASNEGDYRGIISSSSIFNLNYNDTLEISQIVKRKNSYVTPTDTLKKAVEIMSQDNVDILPIIENDTIVGILSYKHILSVYKQTAIENEGKQTHLSLSRQRLKMLVRGQKLISVLKIKK